MATINKIDEIEINDNEITYNLGYKQLDSILNGIKEGSIVTIGARPGMGKSTLIDNIVLNLLEQYNLPTLLVSLELNKENTILRLATTISEKSFFEVRKDDSLIKVCKDKFISKNYNLYISDDCRYIHDLEQLISENKDIKFLVIDYIQLMNSEKSFNSRTDSFNDVLDRLRVLANKHKLVIFLLSQISRSVEYREDKRPLLSDLSSSNNLEYVSDIVILLYRESYDNEIKNHSIEIMVSKNRYGPVGGTYLEYDRDKSRFIDY